MFWGYSPAIDLLKKYKKTNDVKGKTVLNILVAGSSDARHILMTISKYYTHLDAQNLIIHFYIVDLLLEFIAREMLLTLIALEPSDKIGLKEKADLWMEIFGNSMLRPISAEYVAKKSYQFVKMVTNKNYQLKRIPCLNLDHLKYKEKDRLETIFKFWFKNNQFNMAVNWDRRLRKNLGTRYDSRMGAFDWDYYMKIKDLKNGDLINSREYKQWRNTGVAFTWMEKEFSVSNYTMAVGIDNDGERMISFDYLGDIISGPYFCFGLNCEDKSMLRMINDVRANRATDITERNLMRMFYEIEHNCKYEFKGEDKNLGTVISQMAQLNFEYTQLNVDYKRDDDDYTTIPVKHKLIFLPTNTLDDQSKLEKYHRFFDLIYFGQGLLKRLNTKVLSMGKYNSLILMETRKYLLLKKEDINTFVEDVKKVMKEANCIPVGKCDIEEDSCVAFSVQPDGKIETIIDVLESEESEQANSDDEIDLENEMDITQGNIEKLEETGITSEEEENKMDQGESNN